VPALLYIHGFLSSPRSHKAQYMGKWLQQCRPHYQYFCPFLTPYPQQTRHQLEITVEHFQDTSTGSLFLMGSSLGGFWATWLAEKYNLKAVLINPVVNLGMFRHEFINTPLKNYHTPDTYTLTEEDIDGFSSVNLNSLSRPENYLLLVQTGDDVLDYRLSLEKYSACQKIMEQGGDHSFINFEGKVDLAMEFLEAEV
jgi:uncharacterized protein